MDNDNIYAGGPEGQPKQQCTHSSYAGDPGKNAYCCNHEKLLFLHIFKMTVLIIILWSMVGSDGYAMPACTIPYDKAHFACNCAMVRFSQECSAARSVRI